MPIPLPIETERLLIRPFTPSSDSHAMVEVYCDPDVMRFIPGGALAGEETVRALLESYAGAQAEHGFSSWALVERETGRLSATSGSASSTRPATSSSATPSLGTVGDAAMRARRRKPASRRH